jgi:hypothetical protein
MGLFGLWVLFLSQAFGFADPKGTTVKSLITNVAAGAQVRAGQVIKCQVQIQTGPNTFSTYSIGGCQIMLKKVGQVFSANCTPYNFKGVLLAGKTYTFNTQGILPSKSVNGGAALQPGDYELIFFWTASWQLLGGNGGYGKRGVTIPVKVVN